jgi:hypothetical protein
MSFIANETSGPTNTRGTPKLMRRILLCRPRQLETDTGGTIVEVEPSRQ